MATYYVDTAVGSDANAGTSAGAGNAWQTLAHAAATAVAGDLVNVKASGTYTLTTTVTPTNAGSVTAPITYRGYTTSPGDGGKPLVTSATNSVNLFTSGGKGHHTFDSFTFTHTAATRGQGFHSNATASYWNWKNCTFDGFSTAILGDFNVDDAFPYATLENCEVKNSTGVALQISGTTVLIRCYIHDNVGAAFLQGGRVASTDSDFDLIANRCVFARNAYAVNNTLTNQPQAYVLIGCTLAFHTTAAINVAASVAGTLTLILVDVVVYGNTAEIVLANAPGVAILRNNCFGSNGTGSTNLPAGPNDGTLTANPFTDGTGSAGHDNWGLNNTAGGGAVAKAILFSLPGSATSSYLDSGAAQHQDAGGGGGGLFTNSFGGGLL